VNQVSRLAVLLVLGKNDFEETVISKDILTSLIPAHFPCWVNYATIRESTVRNSFGVTYNRRSHVEDLRHEKNTTQHNNLAKFPDLFLIRDIPPLPSEMSVIVE
jgi:hypothetical protein